MSRPFKSSITTLLWFNRYQLLLVRDSITILSNKTHAFHLLAPLAVFLPFCMSSASAFVYAWCIALRIWNDGRRGYHSYTLK